MNRTGLLAVVAVMLASSPSFAQFGGMGGMGGGMGGMGGGRGGQGPSGMMMQSGRSASAAFTEVHRSARVEMDGGQVLSGKVGLRPVIVDGDLGQYVITPDKIKMIKFLKSVNEPNPGGEADRNLNLPGLGPPTREQQPFEAENDNNGGAVGGMPVPVGPQGPRIRRSAVRAGRDAGGGLDWVPDASSPTGTALLIRAKVSTCTEKEIIGMIHIPSDFTLELDFGELILAPAKLRAITFTEGQRQDKPAQGEAPDLDTHEDAGRAASGLDASPPRYFRQGRSLIVMSPVGDRVTLYNLDTKKSDSLELSGSKAAPLEVTPIVGGNLVALMLRGSKLTHVAVADTESGTWQSQSLRKPIDGQAVPIVAPGVVVYAIGRVVYAYGAEAQRWGVAEMPDGVPATPIVGPGGATIESHGHIYTFDGKTGKWDHVDVRAIAQDKRAEKK